MNSAPLQSKPWAVAAAVDASCSRGGEVRKFLWKVSEANSTRADFVLFMAVFEALHQSPTLPALIALVAKLFPQPGAGKRLKCLLLNSPRNETLLDEQEERDVLFAIATMGDYQSFDAEALSLRERGAKLCDGKADSASWLVGQLFRSTLNPLGEEILAGLISAMDPDTARQVTSKQPEFLPALFRAKPSLASSPQLWLAAGDRRRELFDSVLSHENLDSTIVGGVVKALLDSGSEVFIRRALDRWGTDAVFQTLIEY